MNPFLTPSPGTSHASWLTPKIPDPTPSRRNNPNQARPGTDGSPRNCDSRPISLACFIM